MSIVAKAINLDEPSTAGVFHETSEKLRLQQPSRVFLDLRPTDISSYMREGADLIVDIGGEKLRIVNFYHADGDSQLYLKDDDCDGLLLADLSQASSEGTVLAQYIPQSETSPFESLTCEEVAGGGYGWAAAALAVIGGGIGLGLGLSGGDSGDDTPRTVPNPQDTTPPDAPTIDSIEDNIGSEQGPLTSGDATDDTMPTVTGSGATPGDTITLYDGTAEIGTGTVVDSGNWSITPATPLPEGSHVLTVTATDPAGNASAPSEPYIIIVDTTAPEAPVIDPTDGNTLSGTAEPGSTVNIDVDGDGTADYTVVADESGNWNVDVAPDLADGTVITATATDEAGNTGPESTRAVDHSPDTTAPVLLSAATSADGNSLVLTYDEALDAANPPVPGDFVVNADGNPVTVSGVTVSGDTVTLTLANPIANGDSVTVSYTDPSVGDDAAATQDLAGNDAASFTDTAVVNTMPDTTAPVLLSAETSADGNSLVLTYDEALDAANPPAPGDFVVNANGSPVTVSGVTVSGDSVTLTLASPIANGDSVTVSYTDPSVGDDAAATQDLAGNDAASFTDTAVVNNVPDTTAPTTSLAIDSISVDTGASATDFITSDNDGLTVNATLSAGLLAGEALMYSTDGGTTWIDISSAVTGTAVSYIDAGLTSSATILMQVQDTAGNPGPQASQAIVIDATAPTISASIDGITDDSGILGDFITNDTDGLTVGATLSAALATGEVLMYSTDGGATWTDISSAVTGTAVSYDDATLTSSATILMQVQDTAGNAGPQASQAVVIDATAPSTSASIDSISVDTGASAGDFITSDSDGLTVNATLSAALAADEVLMYSTDGGTTWIDISSAVTGTAVSYIDAGLTSSATILMQVQDTAGNPGPQASQAVVIDATAPTTTLTLDSISVDTGASAGDFITSDSDGLTVNATLSAGLLAGEALMYSTDGGATWTDISSAVTGTAVSYDDAALTSSATVLMQVQDTAGNAGPQASQAIVIDATAPSTSVSIDSISVDTGASATDFITSDSDGLTVNATLSAGLLAGEALMYSTDGGAIWTDISSAVTGTAVSYDDAALTSSATVLMQVQDTAGNAGPQASQAIVIDTAGPAVTSTVANVSEEGLTGGAPDTTGTPNDTSDLATVSGTLSISDASAVASIAVIEPAGTITSGGQTVSWSGSFAAGTYTLTGTIEAGATTVATLTLSTFGAYTFTLEQPLDHPLEGVEDILGLDFSVTATDEAGNVSSPTSLTINVEDDMPVAADAALFNITTTPTTETGSLVDSFGADGGYVQQISIDGNSYRYDVGTDSITDSGNSELVVSHSFNTTTDELTINTIKGETLVVDMLTGAYSYTATGIPLIAPEVQVAPVVSVDDTGGLLGIVGADTLGLIDLGANQILKASDANNDIEQVVVNASSLISLGLGFYNLAWSVEMAAEFGLNVVPNDDISGAILFTQSFSSLTITSADGGAIDNLQLNEFLATVYVEQTGITLGVTPTMSISATDSQPVTTTDSAVDLLGLSLLGQSNVPDEIQEGDAGDNTLTGGPGLNDRLYGYAGNDTLNGSDGNDLLRGGDGTDSLDGGDGNDILIGGAGPDTLTGGSGNDVFLWEAGDEGTAGTPATDTIADFNTQPLVSGGDIIDLGNLLQGEGKIGNNPGNLTNYLHFEVVGADTVLSISTTGQFQGGYAAGAVDQQITFTGVDLVGSFSSDQEVIANLLNRGNLIVDEATASTDLLAGTTTVNAVITDNDGDTANTSVSFDSTGATPPTPSSNVAPVVQTNSGALLGLVSAGALDIISLDTQDLTAADVDGNLRSVVVAYQPLLSIGLTALQLTASSQLAAELGLQINVVNDPGLLGLVAPSSVLTITAVGGGDIDNLAVNELLATVQFDDAFDLLGVDVRLDVLDATTITATDSAGLTASDALANLLNADALNTLAGSADIIEGTSGNDTLSGGIENERLYGFDGNDTLDGGAGDDLLRGGSGDDALIGGDGNDVLIDGNGSDTFNAGAGDDTILISGNGFASIDGGDGFDILQMDGGFALNFNDATNNVDNIEQIDLGTGDAGNTLTLTAAAVESLTDVDNELYITGENNDTLNVAGATATGAQTSLNGVAFDVYDFGSNTLFVDEDVVVATI